MEQLKSYLSFRIGNEYFAANASFVHNIIEIPQITTMPEMPVYMMGVINLRGSVLPVIDGRIKFGVEEVNITSESCIIVMEVTIEQKNVFVGMLVDEVSAVIEFENEQIKSPPSIGLNNKNEFLAGVVDDNDKFIIMLDMNKVFSLEDVISIEMNQE